MQKLLRSCIGFRSPYEGFTKDSVAVWDSTALTKDYAWTLMDFKPAEVSLAGLEATAAIQPAATPSLWSSTAINRTWL